MKKADVLRELNIQAMVRGYPIVSEAMFEDWIHEGLIEGAEPQGSSRGIHPEWDYGQDTIVTGLKILKLKACGARRYAELRPCLWLSEVNSLPTGCIRDDLSSEFQRILTRFIFRRPWGFDARFERLISKQKLVRLRKRIKREADSRLVEAGLVADEEILIRLFSAVVFGGESNAKITDLIRAALASIGLNIPSDLMELMMEFAAPYLEIGGIFGNPDEIEKSGLDDIRHVDQNDLVSGRTVYRSLVIGLEFMSMIALAFGWEAGAIAFRAAYATVRDKSEWALTFFAMGTIAAYRYRRSRKVRVEAL